MAVIYLNPQTAPTSERFADHIITAKVVGIVAIDLLPVGDLEKKVIALTIANNGASTIYFGRDNAITTAAGSEPIEAGGKKSFTITRAFKIWGISLAAGQDVRVTQWLRP